MPVSESWPAFFSVRYWPISLTMSVASRTAWMSSSRNRANGAPRLLQEPAPGKEELLVRAEGKSVRHPGDVVGDASGHVPRGQMVLLGDLLRMVQVVGEQRSEQGDRLLLLLGRGVAEVDALEQERAELVEGPEAVI